MNNFDITNVLTPPTPGMSAVSNDFTDSKYLKLNGGTMKGNIDAGGHTIVNITISHKKYIENTFAKKSAVVNTSGFTMTGQIDMGGNEITGMNPIPTGDSFAVTKKWVDHEIANGLSDTGFTMKGD